MADKDKWSNSIKGAFAAGALMLATPAQAQDPNITPVQQTDTVNDDDLKPETRETYTGETVTDFARERALVTERYIHISRPEAVQTRRNLSSKDMRTSDDRNTQVLYCIAKETAARVSEAGTFAVYSVSDPYSMNEVMWRNEGNHINATIFTQESQGKFYSPDVVGVMKGIADNKNRNPQDGNYVYFDKDLKEIVKPNSASSSPTNDLLREILKDAKMTCDKTFASTTGPKQPVVASMGQFKTHPSRLSRGPGHGV